MKKSDHPILDTATAYIAIAILLIVGALFLVNPHKSEPSDSNNATNTNFTDTQNHGNLQDEKRADN